MIGPQVQRPSGHVRGKTASPSKRSSFAALTDTEATHGNACGPGEWPSSRTTARLPSVDRRITAINAITGGHAPAASLPISFDTDRDVLKASLPTIGLTGREHARVLHISNTLHLAELLASEAYLPLIETREDLEMIEEPRDMEFDEDGNLYPVAAATAGVH